MPVDTTININGLSQGEHKLEILGRSKYGLYLAGTNALTASWIVDSNAPPIVVAGTPASPTPYTSATLTVSGSGVTEYRWNPDNSYFRAQTSVSNPISITNLTQGDHSVAVIGYSGGSWQNETNSTKVFWQVDPLYGAEMPNLKLVRSQVFTNVAGITNTFTWDGRDANGVVQIPGWYTVRIITKDGLGNANVSLKVVNIAEFMKDIANLAEPVRGPQNVHARGRWVVWQDQGTGHWEVYAKDLLGTNAAVLAITSGSLNQENPKTDGEYVVWQSRQPSGNWDIWIKNIGATAPAAAVSSTESYDEINPTVQWPWVVFQSRLVGDSTGPWLLRAVNMLTGQSLNVSPSTQDQLNPAIEGDRVVWQDHRDVGYGEIYLATLSSGDVRRITTNTFGQYHPAIEGPWIVWQDNRNTQVDIYGFDLRSNTEVRITDTPENETRPFLDGIWLVFEEDSLGVDVSNVKLINLDTKKSAYLTRTMTLKSRPAMAGRHLVWQDNFQSASKIVDGIIPVIPANTPPILQPFAGRVVNEGDLVEFNAAAADSDQPAQNLIFTLGLGTPSSAIINSTNGHFSWIVPLMQATTNYVTLTVTDDGWPQLSDSKSAVFTVNRPPQVSLITPTNATRFLPPADININVQAIEELGTIAHVEVFSGTTLLTRITNAPYSFIWSNVTEGVYTLTARALDSYGLYGTSAPVVINAGKTVFVSGTVSYYSTNTLVIPGVALAITGDLSRFNTSDISGGFSFELDAAGNYVLEPLQILNSQSVQGVSTLDLNLIRRHILNISQFDSPYKLLAADANASQSISSLDIALLRRIILGDTNTVLPVWWKFVRSDFIFTNPPQPWYYESNRPYANLTADKSGQDFLAVKVGDVNGSWTVPSGTPTALAQEGRIRPMSIDIVPKAYVNIKVGSASAVAGDTIIVPVSLKAVSKLTSLQFTLEWNPQELEFIKIVDLGLPGLDDGNFGLGMKHLGLAALSWDDPSGMGISLGQDAVIFGVQFRVVSVRDGRSAVSVGAGIASREASIDSLVAGFLQESGFVDITGTPRLEVVKLGSSAGPLSLNRGGFVLSVNTIAGKNYSIEFTESLSQAKWTVLLEFTGDGSTKTLTDDRSLSGQRYYRIRLK